MGSYGSMTFASMRAEAKLKRIEAALTGASMTASQLGDALFMSPTTAKIYLQYLMSEPKRVYIISWIHWGKGRAAAIYTAGNKQDTPERTAARDKNGGPK